MKLNVMYSCSICGNNFPTESLCQLHESQHEQTVPGRVTREYRHIKVDMYTVTIFDSTARLEVSEYFGKEYSPLYIDDVTGLVYLGDKLNSSEIKFYTITDAHQDMLNKVSVSDKLNYCQMLLIHGENEFSDDRTKVYAHMLDEYAKALRTRSDMWIKQGGWLDALKDRAADLDKPFIEINNEEPK